MTLEVPRTLSQYPVLWTAVLLAVVGAADYASGLDITFVELMYLVPIGLGTWFGGRSTGVISALAAGATMLAIALIDQSTAAHVPWFNGIGAFGIFMVFVWLLSVLRMHVDREAARLRGALEQLRHAERLNVLGVLAAGVAHELGTPLNVISGAGEMLDDEPTPEKQRELSRLILAQTERITAIIQNLLDFGRRGRSAKKTAELDTAVSAAVSMLASTARKRGAAIAFTAHAGEPQVRGTRQEIEQVVSNLILNGIQAMPRGGRIVVETRREDRAGEDGAPQSYGTIIVADEGTGIAPDAMPHIFDPFFTTKDVGEGTGLGLSVTYGIVSDLGGTIDVASRVGEGTRFTVRLPIAR